MLSKYLRLIWRHSFDCTVSTTDRLSVIGGPLVTALVYLSQGKPPLGLEGMIAAGVAATAGAVLGLRLITASFELWRRDQERVNNLEASLKRYDTREREAALDYRIQLRTELSSRLAKMVSAARVSHDHAALRLTIGGDIQAFTDNQVRLTNILQELAPDVPLRVSCSRLVAFCAEVMAAGTTGQDTAGLRERLREQAKITFRIINKTDELSDMLPFAELEELLEEHGERLMGEDRDWSPLIPLREKLGELREVQKRALDADREEHTRKKAKAA